MESLDFRPAPHLDRQTPRVRERQEPSYAQTQFLSERRQHRNWPHLPRLGSVDKEHATLHV
jgi:hypothetical protein